MSDKKLNSPKVIAEISVNVVESTSEVYNYREQFLEDHNYCPLCGDDLLYTQVAEFIKLKVDEEAHCESCHIRVKQNEYSLQ